MIDTSKEEAPLSTTKKPSKANKEPIPSSKDDEKSNEIDANGGKSETKEEPEKEKEPPKVEESLPPPPPLNTVEESNVQEEKPIETEDKPEEETPGPTSPQTTESPVTQARKRKFLNNKWFWIILIALLLLLLLLILLIVCCCYCRYKKRKEIAERPKEVGSESSGPDTGPATANLVDKSKEKIEKEDLRKGMVTPGSTTSSRTSSPEPGQSPGWRKLMSHAHHPKQILLKEKALLFKDYVQPYHFLSEKDPPNTSVESIYGSTITSYPNTANSEVGSGRFSSPRRKRMYEPNNRRRTSASPSDKVELKEQDMLRAAPDTSSESLRKDKSFDKQKRKSIGAKPIDESAIKKIEKQVVSSQMTEATSMEWDPYLESKQKLKKSKTSPPRRKRNISPISEEDEENTPPKVSTEVIPGSDVPGSPASSETSYVESVASISTRTGSETGSELSPRRVRRNTAVKPRDNVSSDSQSTFVLGDRRSIKTASLSSENGSPLPRRYRRLKSHSDSSANSSYAEADKSDKSISEIKSPKTPAKTLYTPSRTRDKRSHDQRYSDDR